MMASVDLPPDLAHLIEHALPLRTADAALDLASAALDEQRRVRAVAQLLLYEDGAVCDVKEQEVDLGPAELDSLRERIAAAASRLERFDLAVTMPAELLRAHTPFVRIADIDLASAQRKGQGKHDAVRDRVRAQAHAHGFEERFAVLADWGDAPRTVYFLDVGGAMLGGNGLETFLDQSDPDDVVGVLEALDAAGCERLARRYREGLGLIAAHGAQLLDVINLDWLEREKIEPPPAALESWRAIDSWEADGTWTLVKQELAPASERFIEAHWDELVVGPA